MSDQRRARIEELRNAQQEAARKQQTRQRLAMILGGVVILGLLAAIVFFVARAVSSDDEATTASDGEYVQPANTTDEGAILVGEESAPVTVTIFYDYMCPACGAFEAANEADLTRLVEEGQALVELRPISFLDRTSQGTMYSTRTANAIATVADEVPEAVWEFHGALYANQPEEGTEGLSDEEIADLALEAGVPESVVDRFEDRTFDPWVVKVTEGAFADGVEGTPTVRIDGEDFEGDVYTQGTLAQAVEAAGAGG